MSAPESKQATGRKAIQSIGTNALPYLLRLVSHKGGNFAKRVLLTSPRLGLFLFPGEVEAHTEGLIGFKALGPVASPAIEALEQNLLEGRSPVASGEALGYIGAAGLPVLLKFATHTNALVRVGVLVGLRMCATRTDTPRSVVQKLAADIDPNVRAQALNLVTEIWEVEEAHLILIANLLDTDYGVRLAAVRGLANSGAASLEDIPALEKLSSDPSDSIRKHAYAALESIRSRMPAGKSKGFSPHHLP